MQESISFSQEVDDKNPSEMLDAFIDRLTPEMGKIGTSIDKIKLTAKIILKEPKPKTEEKTHEQISAF